MRPLAGSGLPAIAAWRICRRSTEALAKVRAAAPGVLQVDLTRADEFDIGPAWLLRAALDEARAAGGKVTIEGKPPGHFAFFDELPDAGHRGRRHRAEGPLADPLRQDDRDPAREHASPHSASAAARSSRRGRSG